MDIGSIMPRSGIVLISNSKMKLRISAAVAVLALPAAAQTADWPGYGGGPAGIRYSTLKQIDRSNVAKLQVAWSYDTADGPGDPQTQPIVVKGVLYGLTPKHKLI